MVYDEFLNGGIGIGRFTMGAYDDFSSTKLSQDRYDVYVNQDYVGQKYLLTAQESVSDIDDFLRNEGISDFQSVVDGDHYHIKALGNEHKVADVLKVYLQNR
ncbi:hypothetical protein [Metabacillus schmidteae]|uniref:hypothetical protein n=1 Tax=Metabacillus schmidteae TaxID=2730405 RepID=UPI001F2C7A8B|nr:hypothetical protein [Metabacillus schmidteae]